MPLYSTWRDRLVQAAAATLPRVPIATTIAPPEARDDAVATYELMLAYYLNVGLYDEINAELVRKGEKPEAIRGLRNPANRLVEFYATHLWDGPLEEAFVFKKEVPKELSVVIRDLWRDSNWQVKKTTAIRWAAIYGDLFLRVGQLETSGRPMLQMIDSRLVTDFRADTRGYLTFFRTDEQRLRPDGITTYVRTEIWDKELQMGFVFETDRYYEDWNEIDDRWLVTEIFLEDFGINFLPIVWSPFRDIGENRGIGSYTLLKDKIDEVNRSSTRLHQILFRYNRAFWALQGGSGIDQLPIPPPTLPGLENRDLDDDDWVGVGAGTLTSLVPNLNYKDYLDTVASQLEEIQRDAG
jgi:hypothetical protein